MDALLLELETEKKRAAAAEPPRSIRAAPDRNQQTRGSFVDPGDELLTTNIFVGNLATSITEEQMTDLFRQFGEHFLISLCLYRVKRVWRRA
jgi:RNA recognition motif-containing protein